MPQVWPISETFDYGSPAYGSTMIGYLGAVLVAGTKTVGVIHNGYGAGATGARHPTNPGVTNSGIGIIARRESIAVEVDVRATLRKQLVSGPAVPTTHLRRHGVIARCVAGTSQGGGGPFQRLEDVTCYTFEARLVAGNVILGLVRYAGGFETVLTTTPALQVFDGDFVQPHTMRLTVEDSGSDVSLKAYLSGVATVTVASPVVTPKIGAGGPTNVRVSSAVSGSTTGAGGVTVVKSGTGAVPNADVNIAGVTSAEKNLADVLVLEFVDTSAPVSLQGVAGRSGFIVDDEVSGSGVNSVSTCSSFEVRNLADDVIEWRDEWVRALPNLGVAVNDVFGTQGRDLQTHWSRDAAATFAADRLDRVLTEEAVEVGGSAVFGDAAGLGGTSGEFITLAKPQAAFPIPKDPDTLRVSITLWAQITDERDGNELYQITDADETDVLAFGLREGSSGGQVKFQIRIGDPDGTSGAPHIVESVDLASTLFINQTWCFVLIWEAAKSSTSGEGSVRLYAGRFGTFSEVVSDTAVPESFRPTWQVADDSHTIGIHTTTPAQSGDSDLYLQGRVDQLAVFYKALSDAEMERVCNQLTSPTELATLGAVHVCSFEDSEIDDPPTTRFWPTQQPASVDTLTESWNSTTGVSVASGLTVDATQSIRATWSQRSVTDPGSSSYQMSAKLKADYSQAGIAIHATATTNESWSGYWAVVSIGTPCVVCVYRRANDADLLIGCSDDGANLVDVAVDTAFTVKVSAGPSNESVPTGPVVIAASVNGTAIPLQASANSSGVSVNVDGALVDASQDRITSGPHVGMITIADTTPTITDSWQEGSDDAAPPVNSDDFQSMVLPTQQRVVDGNLNDVLSPQFVVQRNTSETSRLVMMDDDRPATWGRRTYEARIYTLRYQGLEFAEIEAIRTFFADGDGPERAFVFDPSGFGSASWEVPGVFQLVEDQFEDEARGGLYTFSFTIEEVPGIAIPS